MLQSRDGINLGIIQLFHVCIEKSHLHNLISLKVGVVVKIVEEKLKELEEKKKLDG